MCEKKQLRDQQNTYVHHQELQHNTQTEGYRWKAMLQR